VFFMDKFSMSKNGKKYVQAGIVTAVVYFGMKYLSPVVSPFILAFLLTGLIYPLAEKLSRKIKIKKSIWAGVIIILFLGAVLFFLWLLLSLLWSGGRSLNSQMPDFQREFEVLLERCCCTLEENFGVDGVVIENFILEQVNIFIENVEVKVLPMVMGKSFDYLKSVAGGISFLVVMIIAVLLIMKDYGRLMERIKEQEELEGAVIVCKKVVVYVKTFVKAQLIILLIISTICAVTLGLAGVRGGVVYGLITGFMDMLPFIGTGIMLIPLALILLLQGSYLQAAVCFGLYAVCALVREFLEPKLIGGRIGVWPVGILFAVFAGIKLFGILGIIKGPLALVIICEICRYIWEKDTEEKQENVD